MACQGHLALWDYHAQPDRYQARLQVIQLGMSANCLHGFGRFNVQNISHRGGTRHHSLPEHLSRLEEE